MRDKLYVIAQSLQQPRVLKRIIQKSAEYKSIKVYGFKREIFDVDNINRLKEYPNIDIVIVGVLHNEKYVRRLLLYLKLFYMLSSKNFFGKKEIYTFGLDLRFICCFLFNADIYYEIADIMWLYKTGYTKKILNKIDHWLTKTSKQVIFTSEGFYKYYYSFLPKDKIVIIENKFKTYDKVKPLDHLIADKIRVAYVGAFRYSKIISELIKIFSNRNHLELNFYGDGFNKDIEQIKAAVNLNPNIHYHGAFNNPVDLQSIYASNNLNFVVYDNKLENERVAMPNKYYESGFFNVPIVCAEKTFVGEKVAEMNMGWVIEPSKSSIGDFFDKITINDLIKCHQRIKELDKNLFENI